jgi:hypothetical protein
MDGYLMTPAISCRSVNGNNFRLHLCRGLQPLFACLSLISPSLRISFRQNGYLMMKEFIASEGSPT